MKVSYSAAVTTNGVGDFSSKLVITGPESQVESFIDGGFYIREAEKTEDGNRYVWENMSAAGRMSFTNTYTYSPAAAPKTGDDSNMLLLCALLVTSGAAAVLWLEVIRRRRSDS